MAVHGVLSLLAAYLIANRNEKSYEYVRAVFFSVIIFLIFMLYSDTSELPMFFYEVRMIISGIITLISSVYFLDRKNIFNVS